MVGKRGVPLSLASISFAPVDGGSCPAQCRCPPASWGHWGEKLRQTCSALVLLQLCGRGFAGSETRESDLEQAPGLSPPPWPLGCWRRWAALGVSRRHGGQGVRDLDLVPGSELGHMASWRNGERRCKGGPPSLSTPQPSALLS